MNIPSNFWGAVPPRPPALFFRNPLFNFLDPPLRVMRMEALVTDKRMECFSQILVRGKDIIKNSSIGTRYCYQLP